MGSKLTCVVPPSSFQVGEALQQEGKKGATQWTITIALQLIEEGIDKTVQIEVHKSFITAAAPPSVCLLSCRLLVCGSGSRVSLLAILGVEVSANFQVSLVADTLIVRLSVDTHSHESKRTGNRRLLPMRK